MVLEPLDDLGVAELEQPAVPLDDGHFRPERGEHGRVLDSDDAGADDDERGGDPAEIEDPVGVEHRRSVELDS